MDLIHQLEESQIDIILNLGFSKFEHRKKFKDFAVMHNYELTTHYLDVPSTKRFDRVMKIKKKGRPMNFK